MAAVNEESLSAASRTPVEIWYHILQYILDDLDLFDTTNPLHCHRHMRRQWDRKHRRWETERTQYRLVCKSWDAFFPPSLVSFEDSPPPGVATAADRQRMTRSKARVLRYSAGNVSHNSTLPSFIAPTAIILSIHATRLSYRREEDDGDADEAARLWKDIQSFPLLQSLILGYKDNSNVDVPIRQISISFPNLVSLCITTSSSDILQDSTDLHFPTLEILQLRICPFGADWDFSSLATWSIPKVRHLFIGQLLSDLHAIQIMLFIEYKIGERLESLEWDAGSLYIDVPNAIWVHCPNLHTITTDLSRVTLTVPLDGQALNLKRIVHDGRLNANWRGDSLVRWAWTLMEPKEDDESPRREVVVEFVSHSWAAILVFERRSKKRETDDDSSFGDEHADIDLYEFKETAIMGRQWRDSSRRFLDMNGEEIPLEEEGIETDLAGGEPVAIELATSVALEEEPLPVLGEP